MTAFSAGVDIVEIARIKKFLAAHAGRLERIFTPEEIAYCRSSAVQSAARFAARFAAKEAVWKAAGVAGLAFNAINVKRDETGRPFVVCADNRLKNLSFEISLSHCGKYAVASVIAVRKNAARPKNNRRKPS